MDDTDRILRRIDKRIAELPAGNIVRRAGHGEVQYDYQWREGDSVRRMRIRDDEWETLREQIGEREQLKERRREFQESFPIEKVDGMRWSACVVTGDALRERIKAARQLPVRDCCKQLTAYLQDETNLTRVCAVCGLHGTGKTTMLYQAMAEMGEADQARIAYMELGSADTLDRLMDDLSALYYGGYRYIFIDEVTVLEDFIDCASALSDFYIPLGMRIVLSGDDSLSFFLARDNALYDRMQAIQTTFLPFRESSRLLGIDSMDEYIRYGGILYHDKESFGYKEYTRWYMDTAIAKNIQHSLECYEYGSHFHHLYSLYEKGKLTGAINRVIEDMNHRFVLEVLTRDFVSHGLGILEWNLRNREQQTLTVTDSQAMQIKQYLKSLDLIVECPIEYAPGAEKEQRVLFTQPGMRYCQAQALVYSLMKDDYFKTLEEEKRTLNTERILEEVRGRMLEDIVLLEATRALPKQYKVFKLVFRVGEFDMVIYDKETNSCAAYEIKHSSQYVREQARHLMDEEKLALTSPRYGTLAGRYVLYLGEDMDTEDGIAYRNAEQFLKALPEITLASGLEETVSEDEGFHPTL